jgi:subtilase family serine protease
LRGLHDFRMKPLLKRAAQAHLNFSDGTHGIAPDDFSTIYDVAPLYAANIDGTGQTIAIAGQSAVHASDQSRFRTNFNLSAQNLKQILVPGEQNPGIVDGDVDESNLDIQWAGAVARGATIDFVYSGDVQTSIDYIVDQNLAPVFSSSYGICEAYDLVDLPSTQMTAQQANAQGQTWVNASGDAGASDCDLAFTDFIAQSGLAVDAPASIPEVTGVGGSQFSDSGGTYWAARSNANSASALS